MHPHRSFPIVAGIICVTISCGTTTGPIQVPPSTYVLRRVAGDPLPAVLVTTDLVQVRVFSDSIRLSSDGTGTISGVRQTTLLTPGTPAEAPEPITIPIHYRNQIDRLEIDFDCPPQANCIPPPHLIATVQQGGLQVYWAPGITGRQPLEYAVVRSSERD
jgi:hypothetical protein